MYHAKRDGHSGINTPAYDEGYERIFGKVKAILTYKYKDSTEEIEEEFKVISDARNSYDTLNDEMLEFAILTDIDGNSLEEKSY